MSGLVEKLGLRALHMLQPETAHDISILALERGAVPLAGAPYTSDRLRVNLAGIPCANPVGLAAGYDKNARAVGSLMKAGFGFIEVGAATPRPQPGNPKPRLFRLTEDLAIINRFGFNNEGAEVIAQRLAKRPKGIPVGLNIGANKDSVDKSADFAAVVRIAGAAADFLTVNVSSPNTEKLRDLQGPEALAALLDGVIAARNALPNRPPVFVKIAPDLNDAALSDIAAVALAAPVDGLIATNTTLTRDGIHPRHAGEAGGLSGAPLFQKSTHILAKLCQQVAGRLPVVGVGGIGSADQAWEKIRAGASAVQIYSGLIYQGFSLADDIARQLDERLARSGITLPELTGSGISDWI